MSQSSTAHKIKMLTPMVPRLGGAAGAPDCTWEDVAGATAGLPPHQYTLLLAIYARECSTADRERLIQWGRDHFPQSPKLDAMIGLAIDEHLSPLVRLCRHCNLGMRGTTVCSHCEGSGISDAPDSFRARRLKVWPSAYTRHWRSKYNAVYAGFSAEVTEALRHVALRLEC